MFRYLFFIFLLKKLMYLADIILPMLLGIQLSSIQRFQ